MRNLSRTMIGLLLGAATLVAPIAAQAQEQGRGRDRGGWQGGGGDRGDRGDRGMQRGGGQERGGWERGGDRGANGNARREAVQQARESARAVERPARVVQAPRADVAIDTGRQRQRDGRTDRNWGDRTNRGDRDGIRRDWNRDGNRDRQANRDRRNDGNRSWSTDRRDWNRDGDRRSDRWDRNWRNDRRYSWQDYRRQNRNAYRLPRYEARHGYSYRRWYPGYRFDSVFYSSNYWINDPFYYRLPPAYGDYRWVRYYDDAVLVDIYSGEIVDIIYSFFF